MTENGAQLVAESVPKCGSAARNLVPFIFFYPSVRIWQNFANFGGSTRQRPHSLAVLKADWSMQWRRWLGMQARNGKGSWTLSSKMLTRAQHRSFTSARLSTARGSNIHRVHQPWASPWRTHETRCDNQAATLPHEWICSLRYHRICQRRLERGKREAIRPAQPRQKVPNLPVAHALTWSAHSS